MSGHFYMMQEVRKWLNGSRDYKAGVALLRQYHHDARLVRLYAAEGETEYKRKRLAEELQKLCSASRREEVQEEAKVKVKVKADRFGWPEAMDEYVSSLKAQWKPLFAEMNSLQARLYDVAKSGNEAEAGRMAHRILDLDDMCDAIYQIRDQYLADGTIKAESSLPAEAVTDPLKMPTALKNAERQLREARNLLAKDAANTRAAGRVRKWEAMVAHYKKELKL